jgi:hypothetical protein
VANENHLFLSIAEIFAADGTSTGSTGIAGLTKKSQPFVRWGDDGMNDRPIITGFVATAPMRTGARDAVRPSLDFDVWVEQGSTIAEEIADRIEAVFTNVNLGSTARTSPVNVAPYLRGREPIPELDDGRRRIKLRYELNWYR